MLNHTALGPDKDGIYLVAYQTPGCAVWTTVQQCRTHLQAELEALRLNREQILQEINLRHDRELRGLHGHYPVLEKVDQDGVIA
jgi:hypothetical protein